jgi:hypothetical protein
MLPSWHSLSGTAEISAGSVRRARDHSTGGLKQFAAPHMAPAPTSRGPTARRQGQPISCPRYHWLYFLLFVSDLRAKARVGSKRLLPRWRREIHVSSHERIEFRRSFTRIDTRSSHELRERKCCIAQPTAHN